MADEPPPLPDFGDEGGSEEEDLFSADAGVGSDEVRLRIINSC